MEELRQRILAKQFRNSAYTAEYLSRSSMSFQNLMDLCNSLSISTTGIVDDSSTQRHMRYISSDMCQPKTTQQPLSMHVVAVQPLSMHAVATVQPKVQPDVHPKNLCSYTKTDDEHTSYCNNNVAGVNATPEGRKFCEKHRCTAPDCSRMRSNRKMGIHRGRYNGEFVKVCYVETELCKTHQVNTK